MRVKAEAYPNRETLLGVQLGQAPACANYLTLTNALDYYAKAHICFATKAKRLQLPLATFFQSSHTVSLENMHF